MDYRSWFVLPFMVNMVFAAEPEIELWPAGMPVPKVETTQPETAPVDANGVSRRSNITRPRLVVFQPPAEKRNGVAAIVIPGGGFARLADSHEGSDTCRWLNERGITAFLLLHRSPTNEQEQPNLGPAQDAQRAMQIVREQAEALQLKPDKIGLFGYSSGGQVAVVAATNDLLFSPANDAKHRPDFLILAYPWRIYDEATQQLRSDIRPEKGLPPTFIAQCGDDKGSLPQGSALLYLQCLKHKVPAELHIYQTGGHGYGMRVNKKTPGTSDWAERLSDWLQLYGLAQR